jgi:hypothetical protein
VKQACDANTTTLVKTSVIVRKLDEWPQSMARSADGEATIFHPDRKRRTAASRQLLKIRERRADLSGALVHHAYQISQRCCAGRTIGSPSLQAKAF